MLCRIVTDLKVFMFRIALRHGKLDKQQLNSVANHTWGFFPAAFFFPNTFKLDVLETSLGSFAGKSLRDSLCAILLSLSEFKTLHWSLPQKKTREKWERWVKTSMTEYLGVTPGRILQSSHLLARINCTMDPVQRKISS